MIRNKTTLSINHQSNCKNNNSYQYNTQQPLCCSTECITELKTTEIPGSVIGFISFMYSWIVALHQCQQRERDWHQLIPAGCMHAQASKQNNNKNQQTHGLIQDEWFQVNGKILNVEGQFLTVTRHHKDRALSQQGKYHRCQARN